MNVRVKICYRGPWPAYKDTVDCDEYPYYKGIHEEKPLNDVKPWP